MRRTWILAFLAVLLAFPTAVLAQQPTTGSISGTVSDRDGNPLPGATVIVKGALGERAVRTDSDGSFSVKLLPASTYTVRVQLDGYATLEYPDVEVAAGQETKLPVTLLPGQTTEITVTSATPLVDPKNLTVSTTFKTKQSIESLPIGRNFTDAVAFAPGVVSGLGTGQGNYSIGGSSGLENSYVIDGVNITDSGYGGVGTYSIVFGSLGTGITTDFLEEIQVKTAGFEAEYGQALGGVITGVVKSGTNEFAGTVAAYLSPDSWEAHGRDVSLPTGAINVHDRGETDFGLQAGGPIAKDRAYWFAAYNPVSRTFTTFIQDLTNPIFGLDPDATATYPDPRLFPGASSSREIDRDSDNYAAKVSLLATPNHRFELTAFGDPSDGDGRSGISTGTFVLDGDLNGDGILDTTYTPAGFSQNGVRSNIDFGADQQSLKYNGLFSGDWFVEAQINHRENEFKEKSLVDDFRYRDRRLFLEWIIPPLIGLPQTLPQVGQPVAGGAGFIGPTRDESWDYSLKVSKIWGNHEVKAGFQFFDLEYEQPSVYSGPNLTLTIPTSDGSTTLKTTSGALVDVRGGIPTCDECIISGGNPVYRVIRARFNPDGGPTEGEETALFIQDTWTVNDHIVVKAGLRTSRQKLTGAGTFTLPLGRDATGALVSTPTTYTPNSYTFDTEISPRIGISFDPRGNGKTKIGVHYARYFERIPSDLAVRQFSNEVGTSRFQFTDPRLTNPAGGPIFIQGLGENRVQDGTKLPYVDEYVLSFEQQIRPDLAVSVRGIFRDQGRVLEDVQFNSVESIQNYYYWYDTDGDGTVDDDITELPFPGFGRAPFSEYVLANPGDNTGGSFGTPEREYKALEVQLTKRLTNNWQMTANYRYSRLRGNYEGLFRNDNGQSDPNITSLFDFPFSPIMRGQFNSGPLNTDRPHVLHILGTYFFDNGFEIGGGLNWQSGTPRTALLAHPNYQNGGELPGQDPLYYVYDGTQWVTQPGTGLFLADYTDAPRGSLGRLPDIGTIDLHAGYKVAVGDTNLKFTLDIFNLFNNQEVDAIDDEVEFIATIPNSNFNKILSYELPRSVRFSAIWDW